MTQFACQMTYMVIIIATGIALGADNVLIGQISQGLCVPVLIFLWGFGWFKFFPKVEAKRKLPEGENLYKAGFKQLYRTMWNKINSNYKNSLRWYFLALTFAEAGANAFTVCAVTFLVEVVKMNGIETGIVFFVVLLFCIPGAKLCELVAKKTNFITAWKLNMIYFVIITAIFSFVLGNGTKIVTYVAAVFWGIALGWFYPAENGLFATMVPEAQATEMAGLYNFCTLIISWIPPFVFTAMNEADVPLSYGLLHLVAYLLAAVAFLQMMPSWDETLKESLGNGGPTIDEVA